MNNVRWYRVSGTIMIFVLGLWSLSPAVEGPDKSKQGAASLSKGAGYPRWSVLNINNLWSWHRSDGEGNHSPQGAEGTSFPKFTGRCVYEDNLVLGARVYVGGFPGSPASAPASVQPVRVNGGTYLSNHGMDAGRVYGLGPTAVPADPASWDVRVYRIRRGYMTMTESELVEDAQVFYELTSPREVMPYDKQAILNQYEQDWAQWPADEGFMYSGGAPYIERNGIPGYQAPPSFSATFTADSLITGNFDEPGVAGIDPRAPADEVIYTVFNGLRANRTLNFEGSLPLGIEIQKTVWAYKRKDAMGNVYYVRYRVINKGGVDIGGGQLGSFYLDSLFLGQWSDIDIGNMADDLAGCDSVRNMGYVYNGSDVDIRYSEFNLPPPACGYLILGGPLVDAPGDSGIYDLKRVYGEKNLKMSSFAYYIAGGLYSDPPFAAYDIGTGRWWKMLRGYAPVGSMTTPDFPYNHPPEDPISKFPLSGDPVTSSGFLDGFMTTYSFAPGDRRILMNSGPFRLAPGEAAELYVGFVAAMGTDRLSSVGVLKQHADKCTEEFDALFAGVVPKTDISCVSGPYTTTVAVRARCGVGSDISGVTAKLVPEDDPSVVTHSLALFDDGLHGDSLGGDKLWGNSVILANVKSPHQLDLEVQSSAGLRVFEKQYSGLLLRPLPTLTNLGVAWENGQQDHTINSGETVQIEFELHNDDALNSIDALVFANDGPFSLTGIPAGGTVASPYRLMRQGPSSGDTADIWAYVNCDGYRTTLRATMPVVPWSPSSLWRDTLDVVAVRGSKEYLVPIIADPGLLTSHVYSVTIEEALGQVRWTLWDHATTTKLIADQLLNASQANLGTIVDGIIFTFLPGSRDFRSFQVVANGAGRLDPPEQGCGALNASGFPLLNDSYVPSEAQQVGPGEWMIHTGGASDDYTYLTRFLPRTVRTSPYSGTSNWNRLLPYDFEIRFTGAGGKAYLSTTTGAIINVPFELWNIGRGTPNDPSDDFRMIPWIHDYNENGAFDLTASDHSISGTDNDPMTDWIYWMDPDPKIPGTAGYDAFANDPTYHAGGAVTGTGDEVMARMVLVNWNGGSVSDPSFPANVNQLMPETGTVFRILTTGSQIPRSGDSLLILPWAPSDVTDGELADLRFELENNYPNPFNPATTISFTTAKPGRVTLTVYDLLGRRIATLVDADLGAGKHRTTWDARSYSSGVYVYRMLAGDFVATKKLLLLK